MRTSGRYRRRSEATPGPGCRHRPARLQPPADDAGDIAVRIIGMRDGLIVGDERRAPVSKAAA
jgi:hypothetical protein